MDLSSEETKKLKKAFKSLEKAFEELKSVDGSFDFNYEVDTLDDEYRKLVSKYSIDKF